jgi:hypothetical protein
MYLTRPYWYPVSGGQRYHNEFRKTIPRKNSLMSCPVGQSWEDFAGFEGNNGEEMTWEGVGQTEKHHQH